MYFLLKNIQWEKKLSYGNDINEIIDICYTTILNIYDKTVTMTKCITNTSKYPKYIHSIQLKYLRNFKYRNKSFVHHFKWRESQTLLHYNINNIFFE